MIPPTTAATLLADLEAHGFTCASERGQIWVTPRSKLSSGQKADITLHKPGLLALLAERAATSQGLPAAVAAGLREMAAWLESMPAPPNRIVVGPGQTIDDPPAFWRCHLDLLRSGLRGENAQDVLRLLRRVKQVLGS
jgi:hypothetical protein